MSKPTKTWKQSERRNAAFFGTTRRPLSGGNSNGGTGRDDCMHEVIFLESKHGQKIPGYKLYIETKKLARKEGRTPVIMFHPKGMHGSLIYFHTSDMETVCTEWAKANGYVLVDTKKHSPETTIEDCHYEQNTKE